MDYRTATGGHCERTNLAQSYEGLEVVESGNSARPEWTRQKGQEIFFILF